jgi:hypothetical protein
LVIEGHEEDVGILLGKSRIQELRSVVVVIIQLRPVFFRFVSIGMVKTQAEVDGQPPDGEGVLKISGVTPGVIFTRPNSKLRIRIEIESAFLC